MQTVQNAQEAVEAMQIAQLRKELKLRNLMGEVKRRAGIIRNGISYETVRSSFLCETYEQATDTQAFVLEIAQKLLEEDNQRIQALLSSSE